ncbi:unnamed protein product [Phaeothamnion confervicola]
MAELWQEMSNSPKPTASSNAVTIASTMTLNNGLEMPIFGLGTWRSEPNKVAAAVAHALKSGKYKHLDCAQGYENHAEVGRGIAEAIAAGQITREALWVTTKLWMINYRPARVRPAVEEILKDLGLTYVDQLLLHWPVAFVKLPTNELFPKNADGTPMVDDMDILDTYKELEKLVDAGLVKSIGVSNFNTDELQRVLDNCRIPPAVNQVEAHPYFPNNELKRFCEERGVKMVAYSPLGNISPGGTDHVTPLEDPKVRLVAAMHMKSAAQVLIRWAMQRGTIVIPKSVTPSRIDENADVNFELSASEMATIDELGAKNQRFLNPPFRYVCMMYLSLVWLLCSASSACRRCPVASVGTVTLPPLPPQPPPPSLPLLCLSCWRHSV